jgi:signal transduction histidine kinase
MLIKDNGIGFEKTYTDKIFEVFQRLHNRTYEGTGIGLALCKKIAETHQGRIYAESEVGMGSTFIIYLPEKHVPIKSPAA